MSIKISEAFKENFLHIVAVVTAVGALLFFCEVIGVTLLMPVLLLFVGFHLHFSGKGGYKNLLQLGLLLVFIIFIANMIIDYSTIPHFYIPVAGMAMLTMLLFNSLHFAFLMAFLSSVFVTLMIGGDFNVMIIFLLGGLTGAYSVQGARTRGHLLGSGLLISAVQIICLLLMDPNPETILRQDFMTASIYPFMANGFICAFFVIATSKVFEYLFGVLTNFSLLELSDFNQPHLKRMILEAPGTYQHSLVVGNLAEAAADAIGAHALLARVGSYYHDIGKMSKPEYFTENQLMGGNIHDRIEPSMSKLVILNHVKDGIELARKSKLNPVIMDFIPQHHGTSLVYYFYQRALEDSGGTEQVDEENYRYPGPKPQMKETAITLLADSAEGAVRSLDEPTPNRIEEMVHKVINNKFIDGQLDDCNLTLKEIDRITQTFTRILSAMYHGRVKYPEKKNGNNHRKSAENNASQPAPDPEDNKDHSA